MFSDGDNQRFLVLLPQAMTTNGAQASSAPSSPTDSEYSTSSSRDPSRSPALTAEGTSSLPPTDQKFLTLIPHHRQPSVSSSSVASNNLELEARTESTSPQSSATPASAATDAGSGSDSTSSSSRSHQARPKFLELVADRRYSVGVTPPSAAEQQQQKKRQRPEIVYAKNAPTGAFLRLG